jgi:hypothetical protein
MDARQFFEAYGKAFTQSQVEVANFYSVPCITARGGVPRLNATRQDVEQFFASVLQRYRDQGFADGRISSLDSRALGENSILATIEWEYLGARGEVLWTWTFTYNLYRNNNQRWEILLQTMHD